MKYLLTGATGQLALEFIKKLDGVNLYAFEKSKLDVSKEKELKEIIDFVKPDVIINCSAYNNVDGAENDFENAYKVNSLALKNMALFSYKYKTKIIHFSTDYVFDGKKNELYTEDDKPQPLNKYGFTKLEGERLLKENYENYLIFRVSWLYGRGKQNFLYKLNEWSKKFDELKISTDEVSVPTLTSFVCDVVIKAFNNDLRGLFHLVPDGYTSRYNWAVKYFEVLKKDVKILEAKQKDFNLPAKRPSFSAMNNKLIKNELGIEVKSWDYYLERFLKESL